MPARDLRARELNGFALRLTGDRQEAEEATQDAFVRGYRARPSGCDKHLSVGERSGVRRIWGDMLP